MGCLYALIPFPVFQSSWDPCTWLDFTPPFAATPWDTVIREVHLTRSSPLSSALMSTLLHVLGKISLLTIPVLTPSCWYPVPRVVKGLTSNVPLSVKGL